MVHHASLAMPTSHKQTMFAMGKANISFLAQHISLCVHLSSVYSSSARPNAHTVYVVMLMFPGIQTI